MVPIAHLLLPQSWTASKQCAQCAAQNDRSGPLPAESAHKQLIIEERILKLGTLYRPQFSVQNISTF